MNAKAKRSRRAAARAIAEVTNQSPRTVLKHLDELEKVGLIEPINDYADGVYMPDHAQIVKAW